MESKNYRRWAQDMDMAMWQKFHTSASPIAQYPYRFYNPTEAPLLQRKMGGVSGSGVSGSGR